MKTFMANMRHAARNRETITIGGGEFTPEEINHVLTVIDKMHSALQHYEYGGSSFKKPAEDALRLFNQ